MYRYIDIGDVFEWLIGCAPASPTVAVYQWKVQGSIVSCSQGLMSQLVFSVCWSPEEIESNAREGMGLLAKARTGRQEEN